SSLSRLGRTTRRRGAPRAGDLSKPNLPGAVRCPEPPWGIPASGCFCATPLSVNHGKLADNLVDYLRGTFGLRAGNVQVRAGTQGVGACRVHEDALVLQKICQISCVP